MTERTHFSKTDIGGELLPILTTGLYRDTLDALREYIQNSIDAETQNLELIIDPDTVTVVDDGVGMSETEARRALRLGLSEKNPTKNVGFRGIGIYSAFNLCDTLEIFTKTARSAVGYYLRFDFSAVRAQLLADQERRKKGLPSKIYLEKVLEDAVYVEADALKIIEKHGTKVVMSGIRGDAYTRLLDWEKVESYLQDVIPLPFRPEFKFGSVIKRKFEEEDYRVVPLILQINSRREPVFRPYTNSMFVHEGKYAPKFFPLRRGATKFGFAWICINDARKLLKDQSLRGLLIKKFGFSIATRSYLESFFHRPVFNRRITGEIIIQHDDLLPNAARSDFENNSTRQEFLGMLPKFIEDLSKWANTIQEAEKASEVLHNVRASVAAVNERLPLDRRDTNRLLEYNVTIAEQERKLKIHRKTLETIESLKNEYQSVQQTLKDCKVFIRDALTKSTTASRKLEKDVVKSIQAELELNASPSATDREPPPDLMSVLEATGLEVSTELRAALNSFDSDCIRAHVDQDTYESILADFRDILEELF